MSLPKAAVARRPSPSKAPVEPPSGTDSGSEGRWLGCELVIGGLEPLAAGLEMGAGS
jgi:hypothetical protein